MLLAGLQTPRTYREGLSDSQVPVAWRLASWFGARLPGGFRSAGPVGHGAMLDAVDDHGSFGVIDRRPPLVGCCGAPVCQRIRDRLTPDSHPARPPAGRPHLDHLHRPDSVPARPLTTDAPSAMTVPIEDPRPKSGVLPPARSIPRCDHSRSRRPKSFPGLVDWLRGDRVGSSELAFPHLGRFGCALVGPVSDRCRCDRWGTRHRGAWRGLPGSSVPGLGLGTVWHRCVEQLLVRRSLDPRVQRDHPGAHGMVRSGDSCRCCVPRGHVGVLDAH